ncbi:uncharacterized protein MELLADRAFT_60301 [Melampsora larici-populina 98AG31]|uniref:Secreted protein n=1 Tax=Melampsora larici-populina (strain 98AG31 / pathotype 3-4-7) TaxID=747676 RepID=F4RAU3_MELLP|nr:uncharacterized protein MELLADRAFT_60301 [Melampsora larici-populina 98AG31]EGG10536.1 secreted protein [Melampsora larici-populina 98AG31]
MCLLFQLGYGGVRPGWKSGHIYGVSGPFNDWNDVDIPKDQYEPILLHSVSSEPSTIRNWYDSQISQQCETQRPVRVRSKQPPLRPDDSLNIGTAFFNDYAADKQVVNCNDEDDAYIRNYLASF